MDERRRFRPADEFRQHAVVRDPSVYQRAAADPEAYWASRARELDWFTPWDRVMEWTPPHVKWFLGGTLNVSVNCVDRHLATRRDKPAIVWEGEPGDRRTLTYGELSREVNRCANALRTLGVARGDRVAIYLPLVPEAAIAMLACTRIGAIHSVVFGGFSPDSLRDRINDARAKLLITGDIGYRRGAPVPLKRNADTAVAECPTIEHVVVVQRRRKTSPLPAPRSRRHETCGGTRSCATPRWSACPSVWTPKTCSTSSTPRARLARPKGIVHTTGGYLTGVAATTEDVFDLREDDVFWCTADVGWVTGHSYVVYGPLANGATTMIYEGAPDWPDKDRFWALCEAHGVTILYTAPTAIRAFMKWGDAYPAKHDLSRLRLLGSVGEPINPEAWMWYRRHIGGDRCPVVDTWWQTETGAIVISPLPGSPRRSPAARRSRFPATAPICSTAVAP